jgi:hypothetical protein
MIFVNKVIKLNHVKNLSCKVKYHGLYLYLILIFNYY